MLAGMNRRATDIASEVRSGVADGELREGEWLGAERDLVTSFQASRATVREALRMLEADGYVTVRRGPGGGVFARRPTRSDLAGAFGAHLRLEGASSAEVAAAASLINALGTARGLDRNRALRVLSETLSVLAESTAGAARAKRAA
jgi:GntR family transcriptional regulator, transcriptional repressor for pyruvate dehydrogenase complex